MDDIVVHKFGGSCLREGSDIDKIAETLINKLVKTSEKNLVIDLPK